MKRNLFLILFLKLSLAFSQLSGIYTIGGTSPNYATINDAVLALTTSGINGPVTFNIRSGTYNEKIIIPAITGSSATNRITFQSESMDSSTVKIQNNSNVLADNYVFYLNGADNISIKYLSLYRNLNSASGCRIIRFENGANGNSIEACHLKGKASSSASDHEVVYSTNSKDTCNVLKNNIIENGWYSIFFNSVSGSNESGNIIDGNKFMGSIFGISANYFSNISVINNNLNTINISVSLTYGNQLASVMFNNILTNGGTAISVSNYSATTSDSLKIIGNMVNIGSGNGINLYSCPNTYILYNSILAYAINTEAPLNCNNSSVRLFNNIIKNRAAYPAMKYASTSQLISDYNIIYNTGSALVTYNSSSFATLNAWSLAFSQDTHSFQTNPTFISNSDLHIIGDISASNNGYNLNISRDLDSDPRSTTPDIGADEFNQPNNDAGIYSITNIASPVCSGTTAVMVNLRNYGELPLTQATINWSLNGIIQPTYNWTGNLNYTTISTAVSIGSITIVQNQTYDLKVWTTNPNNLTDPLNVNDTVYSGQLITRLAGNYTIGGASPSYTDIATAISDLSTRGICSPVVFDLRPGDYQETINLTLVNGANLINTITFQSQNHDSTTTRIVKPDSYVGPRIIQNDINAGYYNFKQLTIGRTDDPSGNTNDIMNLLYANHLSFEGCIFKGGSPFFGTAMNFQDCNYITINNCLIDLMNVGIKVYGTSTLIRDSVYIIKNNILRNIVGYNMQIDYVKDSLIIANNLIINDTTIITSNMSSTFGVFMSNMIGNFEIKANKIIGNYNMALAIGSLISNSTYTRNVSNNFISVACPNSSNQQSAVGIYDTHYLDFIHNSIRVYKMPENPNSIIGKYRAALEFGSGTPSSNIRMINNCFESDSSIYMFYDYTSANVPISFSQFDYNNFYIKYPIYTHISSWTASWPNGYNTNSIYVDPMYLSRTDLHTSNPQLIAGTPTYITDDIDGDPRAAIPTIGADECNPIVTAINTSSLENSLIIAPNPANTFVKISYETYKNSTVQIISMDGKIAFEKANYNSGETIDLTKCAEGIYTVCVKTETGNHFSKMVIIK